MPNIHCLLPLKCEDCKLNIFWFWPVNKTKEASEDVTLGSGKLYIFRTSLPYTIY